MKEGRAGGKGGGGGGGAQPSVDERYTQWKSLVPVLYDWLANHNLVWPSLSCRSARKNKLVLFIYTQIYALNIF